jgi:threonine aldolase
MNKDWISFKNDYAEAAHKDVLEAVCQDALAQEPGYGEDSITTRAVKMIREACGEPNAEVHFIAGGTLTNLVVAAAFLKPYESIIAAESGHICLHEAGAIEMTGHKVHHVPHTDGKISANQVLNIVATHADEHMVKPRLVYVSQSTELGTVYKGAELESLSQVCREHNLLLYVDGARLGSALMSEGNDLTLKDLARLCDIFYIGGTKNGALFGEALVIRDHKPELEFRRHLKQRGALLAKGRVVGAQFAALLEDALWLKLAQHANSMAGRLATGIRQAGYEFAYPPVSNQIFPILPERLVQHVEKSFGFYRWGPPKDGKVTIRLVTSWATTAEAVDSFLAGCGEV